MRATFDKTGSKTGSVNYDPYGSILPDPGASGVNSHIGYTGALTDANGLVYLNARYYNPGSGQFLSADPMAGQPADPGSFNLYGYVQGNPINATDPSGHFTLFTDCGVAGSGGTRLNEDANACSELPQSMAAPSDVQYPEFKHDYYTGTPIHYGEYNPSPDEATNESTGSTSSTSSASSGQDNSETNTSSTTVGATDSPLAEAQTNDSSAGESGTTCSFSASTQVATDSGEHAIGNLKIGDKVEAYNPQTAKVELKAIDAVLVHLDFTLEDVTIDGETLHTTPNHPFYIKDKGWVAAANLTIDEEILKADGSYGKVEAVKRVDHAQLMYNLTVHDDHDYFVGSGKWLVHNECDPLPADVYRTGKKDGVQAPRIYNFNHYTLNAEGKSTADFILDSNGDVVVNKTINTDNNGASTFQIPSGRMFDKADAVWVLPAGTDLQSKGLGYSVDGGPNGHVSIFPIQPMTPQQFTQAFNSLPWVKSR